MGLLENKRTIVENKRAVLGIKGNFGEVKGHIDFRSALATSPLIYGVPSFGRFKPKQNFKKIFIDFFPMGPRYPNL